MTVNVQWPRNLTPAGIYLLQQIFKKSPQDRICLSEIKRAQFFKNINWNCLDEHFQEEIATLKSQVDKVMAQNEKKIEWTDLGNVGE